MLVGEITDWFETGTPVTLPNWICVDALQLYRVAGRGTGAQEHVRVGFRIDVEGYREGFVVLPVAVRLPSANEAAIVWRRCCVSG
jgi:hypothetical protein